jgi:hypothetical protein
LCGYFECSARALIVAVRRPEKGENSMSTITTLIYGGGAFFTGDAAITDVKNSGFTTVVAWCIHVYENGDLYFNDTAVVQGGKYVGDPNWNTQLASFKEGTTSVNRVLLSILGPFANIQSLGTQKGGVIYNNFQALFDATPAIDGIDFDNEDLYDQTTMVDFALMLQAIGYQQITFCPYRLPDTWADWLAAIDSQSPGLVTGFNLQCYDGGYYNDPQDWITAIQNTMGSSFDAKGFVYPGLWCVHPPACTPGRDNDCPVTVTSKFKGWQPEGIQGGWIYLYDAIQKCLNSGACGSDVSMDTAAYASAIVQGLRPEAAKPISYGSLSIPRGPGQLGR